MHFCNSGNWASQSNIVSNYSGLEVSWPQFSIVTAQLQKHKLSTYTVEPRRTVSTHSNTYFISSLSSIWTFQEISQGSTNYNRPFTLCWPAASTWKAEQTVQKCSHKKQCRKMIKSSTISYWISCSPSPPPPYAHIHPPRHYGLNLFIKINK